MTLPSSGSISFSQIAVELGKASNATISLNDADVRALAGKPTGSITLPTDFYGKSNSATLTVAFNANRYGFYLSVPFGSISPAVLKGYTIIGLFWSVTTNGITLEFSGALPNSGWDTLDISGTTFSRALAYYSLQPSGLNLTRWTWTSVLTNPFGYTTGATRIIKIT